MIGKLLPCLGLVLALGVAAAEASYLIQLKDGGEYRTPRYWHEGEEIRFFICGGVIGVPREQVRDIKEEVKPDLSLCAAPSRPARKGPEEKPAQDLQEAEDSPSETYTRYLKAVKAFEDKLQAVHGKSAEELAQLVREGEELKRNILEETMKEPPAPEVTPLLSKLDQAFDRIEEVLEAR